MTKILRKTSRMIGAAVRGTGDDWPRDDIRPAVCHAHLTVNPTQLYRVCAGKNKGLGARVAFFYCRCNPDRCQSSTNGGSSSSALVEISFGIPLPVEGPYHYSANNRPFIAALTNHGHGHRQAMDRTYSIQSDSSHCGANRRAYLLDNNRHAVQIPNTLRTVEGKFLRKDARLVRRTENETAPVEFIIEHSQDGIHFTPSGNLRGRYDEGPANMYRFVDPQPVYGPIFYRLTMMLAGGDSSKSQAIQLEPDPSAFDVKVIENPFHGRLRITMPVTDTANKTYSRHES